MPLFTKRKRAHKRCIAVLLSDTHAGHKLGLCNPSTVLINEHGDNYSPQLSATQQYLDDLYKTHIDAVADLADGDPVLVFHNGDITQGTRYADHLIATLIVDQVKIAVANLSRWYTHKRINLALVRVVVGTSAHSIEGTTEQLVAAQLAALYPKLSTSVMYHLQFVLKSQRGQVLDLAHHGPFPGSRKWLRGNSARFYLRDAMMAEMIDGLTPARVYARAHYHEWLRETVRVRRNGVDATSDLVITPSYSGIDDYVRRATRSKRKIDHGLVACEFEDGLRDVYPLYQQLDIRSREEWSG